ncbi:MAG: tetratricopeptide repeat protein [Candidatus Hermodarchaeota archaeon]
MTVSETLQRATQLMYQGKMEDALDKVENLEKMSELAINDRLECQLLKSNIQMKMGHYDQAIDLAQAVFNESEQQKHWLNMIDALITRIEALWRIGKYSESFDLITQGEQLLSKISQASPLALKTRKAWLNYHKSVVYFNREEIELAYDYVQRSLALGKEFDNKRIIALSFNMLGNIFSSKNEPDKTLEYYQKALALFEKLEEKQFIAFVLSNTSGIYLGKGELNKAIEYQQRMMSIYKDLGNKQFIGWGLAKIGYSYQMKGELDQALTHYQKSLALYKELNIKQDIAGTLKYIAYVYQRKGKLKLALEHYQQALALFEELDMKREVPYILESIGRIYVNQGELDSAIELYKRSLALFKEHSHKESRAGSYVSLGEIYHIKGWFDLALDYYQKSLDLSSKELETVTPLFKLIKLSIDTNMLEQGQAYLHQLEQIKEKFKDIKLVDQFYRVAQAMLLKTSNRVIQKGKAQELFQQVAEEKIINHELTIQAVLNLSELLLDELRMSGNEEVLKEVNTWSNKLLELAQAQNSHSLLVETYLLQSNLALLELDTNRAQELLSQAQHLAEEKGLGQLATRSSTEYNSLVNQIRSWKNLIHEKPSMSERVKLTQLENLVERMLRKRLLVQEEEIIDYARQARQVVDDWTSE